jgi:hypothetical protein
MNGSNTVVAGITRCFKIHRLAIHQHLTGAWLVHARQDSDQRRFTSAIVAEQAENFTSFDL